MYRRYAVSFVFFGFFSSAHAASPWFLYKNKQVDALMLADVRPMGEHQDAQGIKHVRMQQYYQGFLVLGGEVVAHDLHHKRWFSGTLYRDLALDLGEPPPAFALKKAQALALIKAKYTRQRKVRETVEPMVYVDDEGDAHWAYQVRLWLEPHDAMPTHLVWILDASSWEVLLSWDEIKTAHVPAKAQGYGGNLGVGLIQYGADKPLLSITRDVSAGRCYLDDQRVVVLDMQRSYGTQSQAVAFKCGAEEASYWTGDKNDGYDQINDGYSPSNDAFYVGQVVRDFYLKRYGVEPLDRSLTVRPLIMRVHYGEKFENAFWDGKQMTFGDGGHSFYPLVSLSIGAHEVSHGFTERHSNLAYVGQSGGMNESFSDMAAQAVQAYVEGKNNWLIGAEILKEKTGQGAIRYMDRPSLDGRSIEHAQAYRKGMNVHYSSGVYNRFFYLLATSQGFDTQRAFQIVLKANMDYWVAHTTFKEGACGVVWAAMDLEMPTAPVVKAFSEVGIDATPC
ncbi:MAG: M4 family metallopeptidase [Legionellaceae bacterium]